MWGDPAASQRIVLQSLNLTAIESNTPERERLRSPTSALNCNSEMFSFTQKHFEAYQTSAPKLIAMFLNSRSDLYVHTRGNDINLNLLIVNKLALNFFFYCVI